MHTFSQCSTEYGTQVKKSKLSSYDDSEFSLSNKLLIELKIDFEKLLP